MATLTYPYTIANGEAADGQEVMQNFEAAREFVNDQLIQADGSVAMSAQLQLVGDPVASNQAARKAYVDNWMPAGAIVMFGGSVAPSGWALCDGTSYAFATYPATGAALGYSSGNFPVPDLRSRFPVGKAASGYAGTLLGTGGSADATLVSHTHTQTEANLAHAHGVSGSTSTDGEHDHGLGEGAQLYYVGALGGEFSGDGGSAARSGAWDVEGAHSHTVTGTTDSQLGAHSHTNSTEGSSATNANLPPYYVVNYIIRMR